MHMPHHISATAPGVKLLSVYHISAYFLLSSTFLSITLFAFPFESDKFNLFLSFCLYLSVINDINLSAHHFVTGPLHPTLRFPRHS